MESHSNDQVYDAIVIGAGLYGIAGARTYLEVHPDCKLLILDQDSSVGGSWNARRNYETFWTQTGLRMTEFSDKLLLLPEGEDTYHDTFRAKHVTQYLNEYIDEHVYYGESIRDRMLFDFRVDRIERLESTHHWAIHGTNRRKASMATFQTCRLMVATGMTSEPNMPSLPNREDFKGPILHSEGFGESTIFTSPGMHRVVVIGGGKSSADMVYAMAKADKEVTWVIRKSGTGPAAFIDIKGHGRYKNAAEIGCTRLMTSLGPSAFPDSRWKDSWVHRSRLGRALLDKVWANADRDIREEANYFGRAHARQGYEQLATDTHAFWCNGAVGLLQHPDFWDVIASKVAVHREDISHLSPSAIHLATGPAIPCDAILCGTGWKQSYSYFSDQLLCELGLPHPLDCHCLEDSTGWMMLHDAADRDVLKAYPKLASPPSLYRKPMTKTPYRLYKCMAALDEDSIVFLGQVKIANNFRVAECQAIWATAYLDGILELPSYEDMQTEIAYVNAWCQRRYPSNGAPGNYMHYDVIAYTDALLAEIGLKTHRKGVIKDFLEPCWASDLSKLIVEYLELCGTERRRVRTRTMSSLGNSAVQSK